jgi:nucleoside-diphosphate-sugar epimerase
MKEVLIVGADSFIGINLAPILRNLGHSLVYLEGPSKVGGLDLADQHAVRGRLRELPCQSVVFLSSYPDKVLSAEVLEATVRVNVLGFTNFITTAMERGLERFIFLGSYKQYGDQPAPYTESTDLRPSSVYAASKIFCESLLDLSSQKFGFSYCSLRLSTVYGPGQHDMSMLIPGTIMRCLAGEEISLTDGEQRREVTYVSDACFAIARALDTRSVVGSLNVGSGDSHSVREIVETIHRKTRSHSALRFGAIPYRSNEVWDMTGDTSLARRLLDWHPKYDLETGLKMTIESFVS